MGNPIRLLEIYEHLTKEINIHLSQVPEKNQPLGKRVENIKKRSAAIKRSKQYLDALIKLKKELSSEIENKN